MCCGCLKQDVQDERWESPPGLEAFCESDVGEGQALALRYIKSLRTFSPGDG